MIDEDTTANRSELIKRARESCNRSIGDDGTYSSNNRMFRKSRTEGTKLGDNVLKTKLLIIRVVIAVVILLSIIFIDQFKINYNNFNSISISKMLHSNHLYEMAKGYVDKYFNNDGKEDQVEDKSQEDETGEVMNVEE